MEVIAYYLGQFHPTEENDRFWGAGFTEWHNVVRARPLYPGHAQPKLPGALGFYDLRAQEAVDAQMELASRIGITAFCYWHYWFKGRRVLTAPLERLLASRHPAPKVMLGWANESWTGIWHGSPGRMLIEQAYSDEDIADHAALIATYAQSDRYLSIGGKTPFLVYKPRLIPSPRDYWRRFRDAFGRAAGRELYLIGQWDPGSSGRFADPADVGMDAAVVTPMGTRSRFKVVDRAMLAAWITFRKLGFGPEVRPYDSVIGIAERAAAAISGISHATVVTGWDNTPRSGRRGLVLTGYDADALRRAGARMIELERRNETPLLFVKSWNEWAEGNVVEPQFRERWSAADVLADLLGG